MTANSRARGGPTALAAPDGSPAIRDWSLDAAVRHINHGSCGAVPLAAQEAQSRWRALMESNPNQWFRELPERVAAARQHVADFLGGSPDRLVAVPSASGGASVVYASLTLARGATIVVTDHCYGALRMGAERVARRWGATVVEVPVPLDADDTQVRARIDAAVNASTALVIVDQVTSATARGLPVDGIVADAHTKGARVLVDAAHVPGLVDRPLASCDADYWIGNLHKFACSPRGAAVVYAQPDVAQELYPLIDSWGALEAYPQRFDKQGTIDLTAFLSASAALELIESHYGWENVRGYAQALVDDAEPRIAAALSERLDYDAHAAVASPARTMRLVRLPEGVAATPDAAMRLRRPLAEAGFETAVNAWDGVGYLRLSAHAYNTVEDYDAFIEHGVPVIARAAGQLAA